MFFFRFAHVQRSRQSAFVFEGLEQRNKTYFNCAVLIITSFTGANMPWTLMQEGEVDETDKVYAFVYSRDNKE